MKINPFPIRVFHLAEQAERSFAYAQATCDGHYVWVAGTTSMDDDFAPTAANDMGRQMENIYRRIGRTLEAHGSTFGDVLQERIYVTDMNAMLAANNVRLAVYGSHTPAATAIEVSRLAFVECLVEIELVARYVGRGAHERPDKARTSGP
jgi:2-iminobutanoate/2-iminopropanoate deaminase